MKQETTNSWAYSTALSSLKYILLALSYDVIIHSDFIAWKTLCLKLDWGNSSVASRRAHVYYESRHLGSIHSKYQPIKRGKSHNYMSILSIQHPFYSLRTVRAKTALRQSIQKHPSQDSIQRPFQGSGDSSMCLSCEHQVLTLSPQLLLSKKQGLARACDPHAERQGQVYPMGSWPGSLPKMVKFKFGEWPCSKNKMKKQLRKPSSINLWHLSTHACMGSCTPKMWW